MVIHCEQVWSEVSNYLDGEVDPGLRMAIDEHVNTCPRCAAVLKGTRNVIELYGDERMLEVPFGYSQRLHRRIDESMPHERTPTRRTFLGWMVATAAAVLILGSLEVVRSSTVRGSQLRSQMAQPGSGVPPEMMVVVADDGRLFHLAGCDFIHDKKHLRTMTAAVAIDEGYTPCVRCLKKYLEAT